MPKSKTRKAHKQKVASRNVAIKNEKAKAQKFQKDFIMNLIKQEQEKGMFDNNQAGPSIGGPSIGGPMLDGPLSFDGDLLNINNLNNTNNTIVDSIIDVPVVDENTTQTEIIEEIKSVVKEN
jgi:hypothetical protein